jgi:hypothetical protein
MRFVALALGALGLTSFTVGGAIVNNAAETSASYDAPPTSTMLTRTVPTVVLPTRSHITKAAFGVNAAADPPEPTSCKSGYTLHSEPWYKEICTADYDYTKVHWVDRPCYQTSEWHTACLTTSEFSGTGTNPRTRRFVARFAQASSSQDLGGRSQRGVANFASMTTVAKPTAATPPLCSFDLSQGQYICPKPTPPPVVREDVAGCPDGAEMCVPELFTPSSISPIFITRLPMPSRLPYDPVIMNPSITLDA